MKVLGCKVEESVNGEAYRVTLRMKRWFGTPYECTYVGTGTVWQHLPSGRFIRGWLCDYLCQLVALWLYEKIDWKAPK